jgi:hypothetical protein
VYHVPEVVFSDFNEVYIQEFPTPIQLSNLQRTFNSQQHPQKQHMRKILHPCGEASELTLSALKKGLHG